MRALKITKDTIQRTKFFWFVSKMFVHNTQLIYSMFKHLFIIHIRSEIKKNIRNITNIYIQLSKNAVTLQLIYFLLFDNFKKIVICRTGLFNFNFLCDDIKRQSVITEISKEEIGLFSKHDYRIASNYTSVANRNINFFGA